MTSRLARFLVNRAARWSRHPWMGEAMRAEFHAAEDDGHGLRFALGCARATLRFLPSQRHGMAIAIRLIVAVVLAVPFAILELNGAKQGIRFLATGYDHYYASLMQGGEAQQLVASAYRQATPLITLLLTVLGFCQIVLVYLMWRTRWNAAHRVAQCAVVAGWFLTAFVLRLTDDHVALVIYLGVPLVQFGLIHWMREGQCSTL